MLVFDLAVPVVITEAWGAVTLTAEAFSYEIPSDRVGEVVSRRRLGAEVSGVFVPYPLRDAEVVSITGADYDALMASGNAPGRFWPEDVVALHRTIVSRPPPE